MKITKKNLQDIIEEELKNVITEKNGYGAQMLRQQLLNTPEVGILKRKLEAAQKALGAVSFSFNAADDEGQFKLIGVTFKVPKAKASIPAAGPTGIPEPKVPAAGPASTQNPG